MRFPTMWYVWPAKPQISLRIGAVWSEPLLVAWIFYECEATKWTSFGVSKLKSRLHRLVCVYTCQNATLLEITCQGSIIIILNLKVEYGDIMNTWVEHYYARCWRWSVGGGGGGGDFPYLCWKWISCNLLEVNISPAINEPRHVVSNDEAFSHE